MALEKRVDQRPGSRASNAVRHIDREKIRAIQETLNRLEADMIRVDVPGMRPSQGLDRRESGRAHAGRFRADEGVLAIGFVPDGGHLNPTLLEHLEGS